MRFCFCTLAIHAPYRQRARQLIADVPDVDWVVLTDEPADFRGERIRASHHQPTGPMAIDFLQRLPPTGNNNGAAAYHDKRFVFEQALRDFDGAIFLDADSRVGRLPALDPLPVGLSVLPVVRRSIAHHLSLCGTWRLQTFEALAIELFGSVSVLGKAQWCHEAIMGLRRDGRERRFIDAWSIGGQFMQDRGVFSGEGGVIGLAALYAGWDVHFDAVAPLGAAVRHEGGGPKRA